MEYEFTQGAPISEHEALDQIAAMGLHGLAFDDVHDEDEVVEKEIHVASVVLEDVLVLLEEGLRMEKDQATSKSHASSSDETTKGRLTFFSRACSTSMFLLLAGYAVAITLAGLLAQYGERHLVSPK